MAPKPTGVVCISDVLDAEQRLAAAQDELRDYNNGTDGMRETLDKDGVKGLVIDKFRLEKLEGLQAAVNARRMELHSVKRSWLEV